MRLKIATEGNFSENCLLILETHPEMCPLRFSGDRSETELVNGIVVEESFTHVCHFSNERIFFHFCLCQIVEKESSSHTIR